MQQLQNILQRLLELARLDGQSARMESSQADEAVYAALHALKAIYGDTIDQITLDIRSKPGPVQIEKSLLTVAVQNLIDNALRYTKAQQPISLRIEAGEPGYLRLRVLDHGPGLSDSERDLAMNRFWRGSQQQAGYGLGLSIVNAIATQHGGTLELLNRKSGGLEARLTVPLADQATKTKPRNKKRPEPIRVRPFLFDEGLACFRQAHHQRIWILVAHGPFWPAPSMKETRWFSSRVLNPVP